MKYWFILLLSSFVCAEDSFITQYEYGEMLYRNPRGIGCIHCHGRHGEGTVIATYVEEGKKIVLKGPDIRQIGIEKLKKSLVRRYRVMPTYFLTDSEIRALHYYLTSKEE
ncbi:c-type cytochrome [Hydrogenimonas urashimensis]|uniref:c-type cytochrome n=1 Tax=Hydrogenimonas urashimensis TaxID=2740515 RepID=UPI001F426107|nr:cytochrome c [Hydrogenimonas urashimensis]